MAFESEKERIIKESQKEKIERYESARVSSRAIKLSEMTNTDPEDCLRGIKAVMAIYDVDAGEAFDYLVKGYKHYSKDASKDSKGKASERALKIWEDASAVLGIDQAEDIHVIYNDANAVVGMLNNVIEGDKLLGKTIGTKDGFVTVLLVDDLDKDEKKKVIKLIEEI